MGAIDSRGFKIDSTKRNFARKRRIRKTNQNERHGHNAKGIKTLNNGIRRENNKYESRK